MCCAGRLFIVFLLSPSTQQISGTNTVVMQKAKAFCDILARSKDMKGDAGYAYVLEQLAGKLVELSETQVMALHSLAFPIAIVMRTVCQQHPPFLNVLLGAFAEKCIYTVPFPYDATTFKSATALKRVLKYEFTEDNKVESDDTFLRRQSGYVCLYAAFLQVSGDPNEAHGVSAAWVWLARACNRTFPFFAKMLHVFLKVAGFALSRVYATQFRKLIKLIIEKVHTLRSCVMHKCLWLVVCYSRFLKCGVCSHLFDSMALLFPHLRLGSPQARNAKRPGGAGRCSAV